MHACFLVRLRLQINAIDPGVSPQNKYRNVSTASVYGVQPPVLLLWGQCRMTACEGKREVEGDASDDDNDKYVVAPWQISQETALVGDLG